MAAKKSPPAPFDERVEQLEKTLGGMTWDAILEDGSEIKIETRDMIACLDAVMGFREANSGPIPDGLHHLVPKLKEAVGVPEGEGTILMALIATIRQSE